MVHRVMLKKGLLALVVLLLLLSAPVGLAAWSLFAGNLPLEGDVDLPNGAKLIKDGYVAVNVVPAGERAVVLIDCGDDENGLGVLRELQRRGLGADAVKAIFLTHGHADHTGGCHVFSGAPVMALAPEVPVAAGEARTKGPMPSLVDTPVEKRARVSRTLTDGEVVTVGPLTVKVYAVPGHTQGSAAYLAAGVLYLGDSAMSTTDRKLAGAPWVVSDDQAQNRASLVALAQRLKAEGAAIDVLAFSHSGVLDGFKALEEFAP